MAIKKWQGEMEQLAALQPSSLGIEHTKDISITVPYCKDLDSIKTGKLMKGTSLLRRQEEKVGTEHIKPESVK